MSRRLRFIPEAGALVEVTCRTVHGRFLLRPGAELNEIVVGILGHAQRTWGVKVCAFAFLSNHYHLLVWAKDAHELAGFMNLLNSKLAREVGRLTGWKEKIWSRRYQSIPVSCEEAAQVERLRYVLAHGCKEGLVERPGDWPGVHAVRALLEGTSLEGTWFDRTQECAARKRGEDFDRLKFATSETVTLSPLPCWGSLPPEAWRARIADVVAEIEATAAAERSRTGVQPLGRAAILKQRYEDRPDQPKKSCAPFFHAASRRVRKELYEAYAWFVSAYREASEKLRSGDRTAIFPAGELPARSAVRADISLARRTGVWSPRRPRAMGEVCLASSLPCSPGYEPSSWASFRASLLRLDGIQRP